MTSWSCEIGNPGEVLLSELHDLAILGHCHELPIPAEALQPEIQILGILAKCPTRLDQDPQDLSRMVFHTELPAFCETFLLALPSHFDLENTRGTH